MILMVCEKVGSLTAAIKMMSYKFRHKFKGGDLHTLIFDWDTPNGALNNCTVNINCFNYLYIECPNQFFECANQFPKFNHIF